MTSTRQLAVAASAFGGILAGATADRGFVGMPALFQLGPNAWAEYSRHADLSIRGAAFYPTLAFGQAAFSIAAAVKADRNARLPASIAALLTIGGLALTLKAAPNMLSVRHLGDDTNELRRAMRGFAFWSAFRGACQIGAFAANLWTVATLTTSRR